MLVGTIDSCEAALLVGVSDPIVAVEIAGTSTVLMFSFDRNLPIPTRIGQRHVIRGVHLLLGAMVSSGASLRWFRDQFGRSDAIGNDQSSIDVMRFVDSASVTAYSREVKELFSCLYMMGERSPLVEHKCARRILWTLTVYNPASSYTRHHGGRGFCSSPQYGVCTTGRR